MILYIYFRIFSLKIKVWCLCQFSSGLMSPHSSRSPSDIYSDLWYHSWKIGVGFVALVGIDVAHQWGLLVNSPKSLLMRGFTYSHRDGGLCLNFNSSHTKKDPPFIILRPPSGKKSLVGSLVWGSFFVTTTMVSSQLPGTLNSPTTSFVPRCRW